MTSAATPTPPGALEPVDIDVDALARAVLGVPGVADLSSGTFGEIATYLPGRRVAGIRLRPDQVVLAVVAQFGASLPMLATAIRATVAGRVPGVPCDVRIEDITDPVARNLPS